MAETKGKDKSRTIDWEKLYNEELLKPIFDYVVKNKDKYFIAYRDGEIIIYYRGLKTITLRPKSKENWSIIPRKRSKTKTKDQYIKISDDYEKALKDNGFNRTKESMLKGKDYTVLLKLASEFINDYCGEKETEKTIQGEIACKYQSWNNDYLCVDMEYAQSFDNAQEQKDSRIKGRCDYIFLKKETDTKYKLIYIELKSKKSSCTGYTSAIIDHYSDMMFYIDKYKNENDPWKIKETIKAGVKFAVKRKVDLKLIDSDISDYIDFDNPEYRILFKMTKDEKQPTTQKEIEALIDEELRKAKATNSSERKAEMDKNRINVGEDKIPKYELEKDGNYIKYIKQVKEDVLNNSYYDDSDGFVRIK